MGQTTCLRLLLDRVVAGSQTLDRWVTSSVLWPLGYQTTSVWCCGVCRKLCCVTLPKWSQTIPLRPVSLHLCTVPATTCLRFTAARQSITSEWTLLLEHLMAAVALSAPCVVAPVWSRLWAGRLQSGRRDSRSQRYRRQMNHRRLCQPRPLPAASQIVSLHFQPC